MINDRVEDELPEGTWVVVPAFNEAPRIGNVLAEVLTVCRDIVVIDDASSDNTAEVVRQHPVWLVRHAINLGQGAALQTGFDFALAKGAKYIAMFDSDGQHQVADLFTLLRPLVERRAHFSLGSRFLGNATGVPLPRRMLLRCARLFTWFLSGIRLTDVHNGLRAMTRQGAEKINLTCNRMEHASEILDQIRHSGLPFVEVPVTIRYTPETLAKGQRSSAALTMATQLIAEKILR